MLKILVCSELHQGKREKKQRQVKAAERDSINPQLLMKCREWEIKFLAAMSLSLKGVQPLRYRCDIYFLRGRQKPGLMRKSKRRKDRSTGKVRTGFCLWHFRTQERDWCMMGGKQQKLWRERREGKTDPWPMVRVGAYRWGRKMHWLHWWRMNGYMEWWMDGWVEEWSDGQVNERIKGCIYICIKG